MNVVLAPNKGKVHDIFPYMQFCNALQLTGMVTLVEQELLILPEKMSSPKVLMGFILLDL
jgi:hypothetical protein